MTVEKNGYSPVMQKTPKVCAAVIVAILLLPALVYGQSYTITPTPFQTALDNAGAIINGACVWTYQAGTTTAATTYSDNAGTPNTNPIKADSAGRFTAYLSTGQNYKFVYENTPCTVSPPTHGPVLRTADNIGATPASAASVDITGIAGEAISAGQAVYLSNGDGGKTAAQWYKADAANAYSSTAKWVGIAPATIASATSGSIRLAGSVTGLSSLSAGSDYYVGTAGALTSTAPATNARKVGQADSATSLVVTADPPAPPALCAPAYTAKTTTYTAVACDLVAATSGTFTVTLPAASSNANKVIWVVNNGTGTITVGRTGSDTVGLATSQTLNPGTASTQGDSMAFISDGVSNWNIL